jgi:hypothetical protein
MKAASTHRTIALHALVAALCSAGLVQAAEIDTGNPELSLRFDNTIKFNYGHRIKDQNANLLKSANFDDGDRNFAKGTVSQRIDWLSELDLVYQNRMGLRVSGAAWSDAAYSSFDNNSLASSNHLGADGKPAFGLSPHTLRYHRRSGELLDAFLFTSFDVADMPVNIKLGRHTLYWGESLATPVHGVNYGQSPIDLLKAYSVPGTDAKELFMPRSALSTQMSVTPTFALAAQYFLDWAPARLPESGSFLGFYDYGFQGAETFNLGPLGVAGKIADSKAKKRGDFGVSARWSPDWLDGTAGFYLRRTSDLLPQANLRLAGLPAAMFGPSGAALCAAAIPGSAVVGANCLFYPAALGASSKYQLEYASGIDIVGFSLSKSVAGISLGADLSYRRNMPLNSTPAMLMPVGTAPAILAALNGKLNPTLLVMAGALPGEGQVSGTRGNTMHGVLNLLGTMAKTPLSDAATWSAELVWNRLGAVTQGASLFKGRDNYPGIDKVTKDFYGIAANFTPTWFQVMPGVDMSAPISYSVGLKGQSAVQVGGNEGAGNASAGVGFDVRQKYRFDFKYVTFFGPLAMDANGAVTSFGGASSLLKDRGFLAATFKTTF